MSDLIRRKDVAEFMFNNRMCTSINNAYDKLKCIPTAYDPDKAVTQLEDRSALARPVGWAKSYEIITLADAIEIVKGGGVDE